MRITTGFAILALGVGVLGWWAQANNAQNIEAEIMDAAAEAVAGSVHGVVTTVSGRDIHLSGIANGAEEEVALLAALDTVYGHRVVTKDLTVLDTARPFTFEVAKNAAILTASGFIPTQAARAELTGILGDQTAGLTMAAGAPKNWLDLAQAGLAALGPMNTGKLVLSDATMTLTGEVNGPEQAAAVDAALAVLQTGTATITKEITLLDDGKPAAYQVIYAADTGARVTGKLPKGLDALAIATAMGLTTLTNNATTALLGDPVDAGFLTTFNGWMDNVETLTLTVGPTARTVNATAHAGIDATALKTALAAGLAGFDVAVTTIIPKGANGQTRINAASGLTERFMGGYWISVPNFNTTLVGCQTQAEGVLENATITFVTNSSDLEPSAVAVINSLASIMAVCAETAGLRAVIGGHTDSSGDAVANLALSQQRAMAVRLELIARGVPESALTALGYGSEKPIADNTTEEGKAKNRRTTIVWSE